MIIRQIFNNNVIRAENQVGHEFVVIGNGLGFKRKMARGSMRKK